MRRGMALVLVLMVSMVLVMFVLIGIRVTGHNLFLMARSHDRNRALYAAEAGIYKTVAEIETLDDFPTSGLRPRVTLTNGSAYQVNLQRVGEEVTLTSTGYAANTERRLQVKLKLSADSYFAVVTEGHVLVGDGTFINGVQSTVNPRPDKGNLHTNNSDSSAVFGVTGTADQRLSVTGLASAVGAVAAPVVGKKRDNAPTVNRLPLTKADVLGDAGAYSTLAAIPSDGVILGHQRIASVDLDTPLIIPEGSVLHVTGDCRLGKGVTGAGKLVVDGETLVTGSDTIDMNNPAGVFLYAEGGISVIHPSARAVEREMEELDVTAQTFEVDVDPLAQYFAERPPDAEFVMRQALPLDAPTTMEFFEYYETQKLSPSEAYKAWVDGDESVEFTGLTPEVKRWLDKASSDPKIKARINQVKAQQP